MSADPKSAVIGQVAAGWSGSQLLAPRSPLAAFTLLELLVVAGLTAAFSVVVIRGLGGGGQSAAVQSAQATLANLISVARTKAMASGQSSRLLINVDAGGSSQPLRFLRLVAIQTQVSGGWQTITEAYLPEGVYVVPGNFAVTPAGLFSAVPWTRADGSALRSTALRSNQITTETIAGAAAEQWVSLTISAAAGTAQSGDLIVAPGKPRPPGSYLPGESPVLLDNPDGVRGLTLSAYGVPALINARNGF
jgi:type II secretory pathway pseudopilin PulG